MTGSKTALCPICRRPIGPDAALPFCSERCKLVDLGNWLGDSYRISDEIPDQDALPTWENECDS